MLLSIDGEDTRTPLEPEMVNGRLAAVREIDVGTLSLERFAPVVGARRAAAMRAAVGQACELLKGRVVCHVNSTATGGGVAEMLQTHVGYARGAGMDTRWLVIDGDSEFFTITKRIHADAPGVSSSGSRRAHFSLAMCRAAM